MKRIIILLSIATLSVGCTTFKEQQHENMETAKFCKERYFNASAGHQEWKKNFSQCGSVKTRGNVSDNEQVFDLREVNKEHDERRGRLRDFKKDFR